MINKIKTNIFQLHFKEFGSCVYLLKDKLILIDTSSTAAKQELLADLKELNIKPEEIKVVILTHNHYDHIENLDLFKNAKIYKPETTTEIKELKEMQVIEAPGHTQNDKVFLYKDILFSGDVLFDKGYIGRTDFPESNETEMQSSLEKIKKLKYKILCPGHLV